MKHPAGRFVHKLVFHKHMGQGKVLRAGPGPETATVLFDGVEDSREIPVRCLVLLREWKGPVVAGAVTPPRRPYRELNAEERLAWEGENIIAFQRLARKIGWRRTADKYGVPEGSLGKIKARWHIPTRECGNRPKPCWTG